MVSWVTSIANSRRARDVYNVRSSLRSGSFEDKLKAIKALGEIGDPETIHDLEEFCRIGPESVELLLDSGQQRRMQIAYPSGIIPYREREMLWTGLAGSRNDLQTSASAAIANIRRRAGVSP